MRYLPGEFPPWEAVYQQTQRWLKAQVFESMVDDLRAMLRLAQGKAAEPSAIVLDSRTIRSSPESGSRAGYDGHKRRKASKTHMAVDTLGYLLSLHVTRANEQERAEVAALAQEVQEITGQSVEMAYVDQGRAKKSASARAWLLPCDLPRTSPLPLPNCSHASAAKLGAFVPGSAPQST